MSVAIEPKIDVLKYGFEPYDLIKSHKFGDTYIYRHKMADRNDYIELKQFKNRWTCEVIIKSQLGYGDFKKICFDEMLVTEQSEMDYLLNNRWGVGESVNSQKMSKPF